MTNPLDLVRGLYAAFAAGDVPAFLAALAPGVHWCEAEGFPLADRNPYVGQEAIVQGVFARLGEHWLDFRVEPAEFVGSGEVVTMFGRYRATARATGKPLDVQVAHTFWVADGKVVRFQQMCDTAAVAASLRAEPRAPRRSQRRPKRAATTRRDPVKLRKKPRSRPVPRKRR